MSENSTDAIQNALYNLKNLGAIAVKAEFEEEAADYDEVETLARFARNADLKLALKLGGCSAYRDMKDAQKLDADMVIAPMIESSYALKKFCAGTKLYGLEKKELYISIETVTALSALDAIAKTAEFDCINGFVFGRTDYTRSRGESDPDCRAAGAKICEIADQCGKIVVIGGKISDASRDFLQNVEYNSFERFETRKIVFDKNIALGNSKSIEKALEFEILWLNELGKTERVQELRTRLSSLSLSEYW